MTDRQCPSCGGFCKKSGCERRDSIIPCKHFRSGLTNKTAADCPYCRIDELESKMQGLSNEINDFQNIIERHKREIHELQCKQDTPLAFYEISHDEDGEIEYEFSVYPRPGFRPLYTQAIGKEST